jgi:hypothetical protein
MAHHGVPRTLRTEVTLPEIVVGRIMSKGVSPGAFLEFLVSRISLDEWLERFIAGSSGRHLGGVSAGRVNGRSDDEEIGAPADIERPPMVNMPESASAGTRWTEDALRMFFDTLEADTSIVGGLALLAAYARRGPSPTSSELELVCGFSNRIKWTQALRSTKNGLNGLARRMGLPSVFLRPQTIRSERVHPLDPTLYAWIREWFKDPVHSVADPSAWGAASSGDTPSATHEVGEENGAS